MLIQSTTIRRIKRSYHVIVNANVKSQCACGALTDQWHIHAGRALCGKCCPECRAQTQQRPAV